MRCTNDSLSYIYQQACPYVAGVAALYISANGGRKLHGKDFGKFLGQRIIASGRALPW